MVYTVQLIGSLVAWDLTFSGLFCFGWIYFRISSFWFTKPHPCILTHKFWQRYSIAHCSFPDALLKHGKTIVVLKQSVSLLGNPMAGPDHLFGEAQDISKWSYYISLFWTWLMYHQWFLQTICYGKHLKMFLCQNVFLGQSNGDDVVKRQRIELLR